MNLVRLPIAIAVACLGVLFFAQANAQDFLGQDAPPSVQVEVIPEFETIRANGQLGIAVRIQIADKYKIWPSNDAISKFDEGVVDEYTLWTKITATTTSDGVTLGQVQWPEPVPMDFPGFGKGVGYKGTVVAYIPVQAKSEIDGTQVIKVEVFYQACDENSCEFPKTDTAAASFQASESIGDPVNPVDPGLFQNFDRTVFGDFENASEASSLVEFEVGDKSYSIDPRGAGFLLLLLIAAFGGFLLNLTPCVLPVIPLKIMGLSQTAGSRGRTFFLGAVMSAGVVAFWIGIALAITGLTGFDQVNELFQRQWFTIGVGVFILVMAIGMLGVFSTGLPQWVYRITPKHDSVVGSFGWGILTAVLSTPCTAPFMGASIAWAAQQDRGTSMTTFAAIGFGMALPYLLLSANPKWLSKVPRSGPSSVLVKQAMGVFLLAVAVFFIGSGLAPSLRESDIDPVPLHHWWLVAALGMFGFGFVAVRGLELTKSGFMKGLLVVVCLIGIVVSFGLGKSLSSHGPVDWIAFTEERYAEAVTADRVRVIDFTAEWCLNCKALEKTVLYSDAVSAVLNSDDVSSFKVDLTQGNEVGKNRLRDFGWSAIPLLVIEGPGVSEPIKLDAYTRQVVLDAIEEARGGRAKSVSTGSVSSGS